jgi:hypothetical protein
MSTFKQSKSSSNVREPSRRALLSAAAVSVAAAAVVASPHAQAAIMPVGNPAIDPIFAAVETHRKLSAEWDAETDAVEEMEWAIEEHRPIPLIAWREYSHIGASEIERAREQFLAEPGADPVLIKKEYRAAKARYCAKLRAGRKWDERHGLTARREKVDHLRDAIVFAGKRISEIKPISVAGCAALVAYAHADLEIGEGPEWPLPALANAAEALESIAAVELGKKASQS